LFSCANRDGTAQDKSVRAAVSWRHVYSVLQNVIFKLQLFVSEGCGRKRAFTGDTEEYHDSLRFDPSVLGEFLARNGLECCRNRVGPYFMSFPFPCISPISNYKYLTCAIVAEQIGLTGGLSNFDPETLPPSVSKGFLLSFPAAQ
jgi:hypothetical protein